VVEEVQFTSELTVGQERDDILFAIVSTNFEDLDGAIENDEPVNIALATDEEARGFRYNLFVSIATQAVEQSSAENWVEDASRLRAARICFVKGERGYHGALQRK
jgi:hypothetical protein